MGEAPPGTDRGTEENGEVAGDDGQGGGESDDGVNRPPPGGRKLPVSEGTGGEGVSTLEAGKARNRYGRLNSQRPLACGKR